jgi:polysaccharide export outer membrane protein
LAFLASVQAILPVWAGATEAQGYPPYLVGPGDLLTIFVYGEKDLPESFLVDTDGTISFPMLGQVKVAGYTQSQLSARLTRALKASLKNPDVTVLIAETNNYNVSVWGQVARPGKYRIRGKPTLESVLGEAGGPLQDADLGGSILIREGKKSRLNLHYYLKELGQSKDPVVLFPNDVVFVPKSPWPNVAEWGIITGILTSAVLISQSLQNRH